MKVSVIFFAALRDVVGVSEQQVELNSEGLSAKELIEVLMVRHPGLTMAGVRVALNEEFVELDVAIQDGDVIALIPPVSGG